MAFRRTDSSRLVAKKKDYFESSYRFSRVVGLKPGHEHYVIFLDVDNGYFETPCHTVYSQKIDGQTISLAGNNFETTIIKCQGINEEGERVPSLCCELARRERERTDSKNRIISGTTSKVHIPVLILGNSLKEPKAAYPVSKVSILNALHSEGGLKFAYIEMASSSFRNNIIGAYGRKLKEEGIIDYDMSDEDPEFADTVRQQLAKTVVKITGVAKEGFKSALSDFAFFPFSNAAIGSMSPQGEREAIINYRSNPEIMAKVNEFLTLFNVEVDNLIRPRSDKDLQEYYDMALKNQGVTPVATETSVMQPQVVEVIEEKQPVLAGVSSKVVSTPSDKKEAYKMSDEELLNSLNEEISSAVNDKEDVVLGDVEIPIDEDTIEYDTEGEDDFFG